MKFNIFHNVDQLREDLNDARIAADEFKDAFEAMKEERDEMASALADAQAECDALSALVESLRGEAAKASEVAEAVVEEVTESVEDVASVKALEITASQGVPAVESPAGQEPEGSTWEQYRKISNPVERTEFWRAHYRELLSHK